MSVKGLPKTVIGNSGEWIHLKVEYMNPELDYDGDGERDILVRIYVENSTIPKLVAYTPYAANSYYNPDRLELFRISADSASSGDILLDNIRYLQVDLSPDGGGKPPVEKDEESLGHNTSTLDKDAWT